MSQTVIRGTQILNNTVQRQDLDTSTVGQAVVTKLVQGSGITLSSTGADSGTGDVTVSSPDVVSTDAGNIATLGTDNHILVPQSQIWSVRLRSFNAVGNPNFEVDQRLVGAGLTLGGTAFVQDRWQGSNSLATGRVTAVPTYGNVALPGTSFYITDRFLRVTLTTAQASLAAGELIYFQQNVEGPMLRELLGDVHSISLLVRSSVAGLKFGVAVRDVAATRSLCKLCTTSLTSGVWTLIPLPNLPLWDAGATWNVQPGNLGYYLSFSLAAGTTFVAPAADTFQTGNFVAPPGMSNFAASSVGATVDFAYIGHEPVAVCTTPMDCPFGQNLDGDMGCMRYFQKSYEYGTPLGSVTGNGAMAMVQLNTTLIEGPRFIKSMAKTPVGLTIYNHANGAANSFSHLNGSNYGITGNFGVSEKGVQAIQAATMPAPVAGAIGYIHYAVDTGW